MECCTEHSAVGNGLEKAMDWTWSTSVRAIVQHRAQYRVQHKVQHRVQYRAQHRAQHRVQHRAQHRAQHMQGFGIPSLATHT